MQCYCGMHLRSRRLTAVPIGICTPSMFGVDKICAVLVWIACEHVSCCAVIAVPTRICTQGMFGVRWISAVLLWNPFEKLPPHRCAYRNLYTQSMFGAGWICAVLLWIAFELSRPLLCLQEFVVEHVWSLGCDCILCT